MGFEQFEVLTDSRENLVIFDFLIFVFSHMQSVRLGNLDRLSAFAFLVVLQYGNDQILVFSIFVELVSDLTHNILDLVLDGEQEFLGVKTEMFLLPMQLQPGLTKHIHVLSQ